MQWKLVTRRGHTGTMQEPCRNRAQNCTGNWKCVVEVVVTLAVLHPLVRGKESMVLLKVDDLWMCS